MLTSHRQKYNPKKPIAKIKTRNRRIQAFVNNFFKKNLRQAGAITIDDADAQTLECQANGRSKKIPLRAFSEKDIIKTRFIYLYRQTLSGRSELVSLKY